MKHKVITPARGKIIIDENAEVQEGNWYYSLDKGGVYLNNTDMLIYVNCLKIIATINFSIDKDIPVIVVEDEVEKLARREYGSSIYSIEQVEAFKKGYKAAQQKGVYSEEDLRKVAQFAQGKELTYVTDEGKEILITKFIQSLKQEYIALEMEDYLTEELALKGNFQNFRIKTNRVNGQLMAYVK